MLINLCDDSPKIHFSELVPYIAVNIDGVPANVAGHMARLAAIEFATYTAAVRRTMWLDTQAHVHVYDLGMEDCYSLNAISSVCCGQTQLRPAQGLDCCPVGSCTYFYEQPGKLYIGLAPSEDTTRGLEIHASVLPGQDSCFIDKFIYDRHAEDIANGAIYRLLMMQGEDWSDPILARTFGAMFSKAMNTARIADRTAYSAEPTVMKTPRGFFV